MKRRFSTGPRSFIRTTAPPMKPLSRRLCKSARRCTSACVCDDSDGQWRWFESRGNPILDDAGNMVGFIGSASDISDIYESQQALKELGRRKDEFLTTLSHELRNPLAPIRNAVEILKSVRPGDAKFEWCRDLIDQQVGYMARLMEDLLDLSRITRDNLELRKQPTDLRAVIRDAIETSRPLIEAGQHELTDRICRSKI